MSPSVESGDKLLAVVAAPVAMVFAGAGRVFSAVTNTSDPIIGFGGVAVAVLGFAGVLVRQLVKQSSLWKEIVNSLRQQLVDAQADIARKDDEIAYITWERESARYRAKERPDPGPAPLPRRSVA